MKVDVREQSLQEKKNPAMKGTKRGGHPTSTNQPKRTIKREIEMSNKIEEKNMKKSTNKIWKVAAIAAVLFVAVGMVSEIFAQSYYNFSLKYRRLGNKVGVELWVKSTSPSAPALGSFTVPVTYNTTFLVPAALSYTAHQTDTVSYDVDQTNPIVTLTSPYHSANGYGALTVVNGTGYAEWEITYNSGSGFVPASTGRGTFVGRIEFDIINYATLAASDQTGIAIKTSGIPSIAITDVNGNALTLGTNYTVTNPADINIKGITIVNPNGPKEVVNKYYKYASLNVYGYPVYFERSGLIDPSVYNYGSDALAYQASYSIDGGLTYTNTFRFAETSAQATIVNFANLASGDIETTTGTLPGYTVTKADGNPVPLNWKGVLRVIWKADQYFALRSEKARFKLQQLSPTGSGSPIVNRTLEPTFGTSEFNFVLGRIFFVQLDGQCTYLRTAQNYSLPTQLTVEAWVNVNALGAAGTEPGIIASSGGANSPGEGAFLLYLEDGQYPAFRVREFQDRGFDGNSIYLGRVVANEPITVANANIVLSNDAASEAHRRNWVHLAGVVRNNVVELYVNGQRVGRTINTRAVDARMATFEHPIWIGVNPNGGIQAGDLINAGIKEVKIWRTALTQEQIQRRAAGVYDPAGAINPLGPLDPVDSLRISLDMYYTFQANRNDYATDVTYQYGNNILNHFTCGNTLDNTAIVYRPDRPHIKLISPSAADGVKNKMDDFFQVRWVGYGLGSIASNTSKDLKIEFSRDGGLNWADALDNTVSPSGVPLDQVEIESAYAIWEPYNSVMFPGAYGDLQGLGSTIEQNYTKTVKLRISGQASKNQDDIYDESGEFYVAPYFAFRNGGNARIFVPGSTDFNLSRGVSFIEMWVYPERFPTAAEGYFVLASKSDANNTHYELRLLSNGLLQFIVVDANGTIRTATSDATKPLVTPNLTLLGKVWTHIGVLVNLANGTGTSNIRFYIDGLPQTEDALTQQLGANITTNVSNTYPLWIGSSFAGTNNFVGEIREFRFWNGYPADQTLSGVESQANPTNLTRFIQGALTSYAKDFSTSPVNYQKNLVAAFAFDGGSFVNDGWYKSVPSTNSKHVALIIGNTGITSTGASYQSSRPYLKLVEPVVKQEVPNTTTNLRIRWVGFHYDDVAFRAGSNAPSYDSDLSFGLFGGGGQVIQPYQPVASTKYSVGYTNSLSLLTTSLYRFPGVAGTPQYAASLNIAIADPDANNDEVYNDQGPLAAALTNARLRLRGRATINASIPWEYTSIPTLQTEGNLFTVTPPSNFSLRVLLEGFHTGSNNNITNLGSTFNTLGIRASLFSESAGQPNTLVTRKEGTGYIVSDPTALDPTTRNVNGSVFATVPFVFTNLADGNYFVVVEHLNHLPAMSRFAAPFKFDGDDLNTWKIESGWDFQSWGQNSTPTATNYMQTIDDDPYSGPGLYSAYGQTQIDKNVVGFDETSLNFTAGQIISTSNKMAALVAGDVYRDGQINAIDRVLVRADIGSSVYRSDVTGDGLVNAIDRDLTDRNSNKLTRLPDLGVVTYPAIPKALDWIATSDPLEAISPLNPTRSEEMNQAAKEFLANGGKRNDKKNNNYALQGGISYKVMGTTDKKGDKIFVNLYIQNTGGDWAPGNCTFGITYDNNSLEFVGLTGTEENPFQNYKEKGYSAAYSGPTKDGVNPIANIRTIEIDYDGYVRPEGVVVPKTWTKLGTLEFKINASVPRYEFEWHPITAVLTTDGRNITSEGQFMPIEPVDVVRTVAITSPNGGENWRAGKSYQITWTLPSDNAMGYLEFSDNAGATWTRITSSPINLMSGEYMWNTPKVNSNRCLVRIVDVRNGNEIDRSNATFTLSEDVIKITRPASTDPIYKFGKSDFIEWTMEDNLTIRFEFSANGKDNWTIVTGPVNSRLLQTKWDIPAVNTREAVVRMVDVNTNQVLAYSTPFRILGGNGTFINPKKGQIVKCGTTEPIRWTSEYINKFDLQLSIDGGQTWQYIARDVNALKSVYTWTVPSVRTDNAVIRAIWNGQEDMEYMRTGIFRIQCDDIGNVEEPVAQIHFLNEPVPNPFTSETRLRFTLGTATNVTLKVYTATGELVATLIDNAQYSEGTHTIDFNALNLPAGVYIVRLNAGTFVDTKEIIHIK